ncbi:hypothetical protein P7H19_21605 [Paenibacillus larvae]|nr:hypothetical protein [Paenibacillus larvae]MDT2238350.1 hypothetical protein [Paenibacillus larvae]
MAKSKKNASPTSLLRPQPAKTAYVDAALKLSRSVYRQEWKTEKVTGMDEVVDGLLKVIRFLRTSQQPIGGGTNPAESSAQVDTKDMNPFQLLKMGYLEPQRLNRQQPERLFIFPKTRRISHGINSPRSS